MGCWWGGWVGWECFLCGVGGGPRHSNAALGVRASDCRGCREDRTPERCTHFVCVCLCVCLVGWLVGWVGCIGAVCLFVFALCPSALLRGQASSFLSCKQLFIFGRLPIESTTSRALFFPRPLKISGFNKLWLCTPFQLRLTKYFL